MRFKSKYLTIIFLLLVVLPLTIKTSLEYAGGVGYYLLFTLAFNLLLLLGFRKNRFFFDSFIGILFWLGFWLKFSYRTSFSEGRFVDPVGQFDKMPASIDSALLVSSIGAFGLIAFSLIREKVGITYSKMGEHDKLDHLFSFYERNRKLILSLFVLSVAAVTISNATFGFYQRGSTPRTFLPFGLGGVVTWLLLFGFTSFSSLFLEFETRLKTNLYLVSFITILESFLSNVSLLSRGMIINMSSVGIGMLAKIQTQGLRVSFRYILITGFMFCFLFLGSVFAVNYVRLKTFPNQAQTYSKNDSTQNVKELASGAGVLFMDRFVGIEGVMAIVGYPNKGMDLWKTAWSEKFSHSGSSFYDKSILNDTYAGVDLSKHHLISLPGSIAFFYYPGSGFILFFGMFTLAFIASSLELLAFKFAGNSLLISSLIGQVIAYRYAHFGYVPGQSYLLLGTIILNVCILWGLNKSVRIISRH